MSLNHQAKRLIKVAIITIIPFAISFAPFFFTGGIDYIKQIMNRLFPFGRGLIHDYWAPNFWALYYFADKILSFFAKRFINFSNNEFLVVSEQVSNYHKALNTLKILP